MINKLTPKRCGETQIPNIIKKNNGGQFKVVVFGASKGWYWWHIVPQLAVYTTYSPCLLGGLYATDPTFYGNQKQPFPSWTSRGPAVPTPKSLSQNKKNKSSHMHESIDRVSMAPTALNLQQHGSHGGQWLAGMSRDGLVIGFQW